MKYILIVLGLIMTYEISSKQPKVSDGKPLQHYVKSFEYLLGRKLTKTTITIGYIYNERGIKRIHVGGVCHSKLGRVIMNKLRWAKFSHTQREALVFHELGHCELGLGHPDHQRKYTIPNFILGNCPKSIMNSGTTGRRMNERCYLMYYHYYIHELFSIRTREILR